MKTVCQVCKDGGWVCVDHPHIPWDQGKGCWCGAEGMPCACNPKADMPPGTKVFAKRAMDLTLAEAIDQLYFAGTCSRCRETREIDLRELMARLGPKYLVVDIRKLLRCRTCGNRDIGVTTLWIAASTSHQMKAHWKH